MITGLHRGLLAAALFVAGAALLVAPRLFAGPEAVDLSSAVIGVVMMLAAVGFGYGSLELWSRLALGLGAWSLVAPVLFGLQGVGFWSHMFAGFATMLSGVAGHELLERRRQQAPSA